MEAYYAVALIAKALWKASIVFSVVWALFYVTLGAWAKVRYRNPKARLATAVEKRYGPVVVSHLLFSLVFLNPYFLFQFLWSVSDWMNDIVGFQLAWIDGIWSQLGATLNPLRPFVEGTLYWSLAGLYFVLLSLLVDLIVMRGPWRGRRGRWLLYKTELKRWVTVHIAVVPVIFLLAATVSWGLCWGLGVFK